MSHNFVRFNKDKNTLYRHMPSVKGEIPFPGRCPMFLKTSALVHEGQPSFARAMDWLTMYYACILLSSKSHIFYFLFNESRAFCRVRLLHLRHIGRSIGQLAMISCLAMLVASSARASATTAEALDNVLTGHYNGLDTYPERGSLLGKTCERHCGGLLRE